MIRAVLFDLGNTLVRYWDRSEFPTVLREAIAEVQSYLGERRMLHIPAPAVWERVEEQDHDLPGHRVYPLRDRLVRIFDLEGASTSREVLSEVCRRFMRPMLSRGRLYADTLPALDCLRKSGFQTAIVSNTPWGSPAASWREEIGRLGIRERVDVDVFCDDVGWRKPAPQILEYTVERLGVGAAHCLFVGDDPRWDVAGPRALGMAALLIDRTGASPAGPECIPNLDDLCVRLKELQTARDLGLQPIPFK